MKTNDELILKYVLQVRTMVQELNITSKDVLTLKEAVKYTGYTQSYIYRLVSKGKIPFSKPNGKSLFFKRKELERWLQTNHHSPMSKDQGTSRLYVTKKR